MIHQITNFENNLKNCFKKKILKYKLRLTASDNLNENHTYVLIKVKDGKFFISFFY